MLLQARATAASAAIGGCKCDTAGSEEAHYEEFVGRLLNSSDPVVKAAGARLHREFAAQKGMGCDLGATKQQVSWDRDDGVLRNVGMCVQMRNDAGILDEYIAFHWLQVGGHQGRDMDVRVWLRLHTFAPLVTPSNHNAGTHTRCLLTFS